jgi:hypothetical protein
MDKENLKSEAWRKLAGSEMGHHVNPLYDSGFDAGWDARSSAWVRIETEADLPKDKGFYLTAEPDRNSGDKFNVSIFDPHDSIFIVGWMRRFQAWMPIPPFEGEPK